MFSMQCRKNITVEDNKKRINITNFINIYVTRMIQNKNDSINSMLQEGRAGKYCCVVFPTLQFPYLILCARQCNWKVGTPYLTIRTKNN